MSAGRTKARRFVVLRPGDLVVMPSRNLAIIVAIDKPLLATVLHGKNEGIVEHYRWYMHKVETEEGETEKGGRTTCPECGENVEASAETRVRRDGPYRWPARYAAPGPEHRQTCSSWKKPPPDPEPRPEKRDRSPE